VVTKKSVVFWDMRPCGSCNNRRFGGMYSLHNQQLLVTANVPSSLILVTLMMEVIRSSETSVLTETIWRYIPDNGILESAKRLQNQDLHVRTEATWPRSVLQLHRAASRPFFRHVSDGLSCAYVTAYLRTITG
jgi:hypothetical protein